jgi:type III pantothenate kinase
MNLCVDQGNTLVKIGVFKDDVLVFLEQYQHLTPEIVGRLINAYPLLRCIVSSTALVPVFLEEMLAIQGIEYLELDAKTLLPFTNAYLTPATLGKDRLAAVAGAQALKPNQDVLVVDAGTAITYDFLDAEGVYHGGNIAPGLEMRAAALHQFTHRLPRVELYAPKQILGNDTLSAINNGIVYGAVFEIDGYINSLLLNYPKLCVFLTGGSAFYFDNLLKNRTFATKNLVLTGLNRILSINVQ